MLAFIVTAVRTKIWVYVRTGMRAVLQAAHGLAAEDTTTFDTTLSYQDARELLHLHGGMRCPPPPRSTTLCSHVPVLHLTFACLASPPRIPSTGFFVRTYACLGTARL